MTDNIVLVNEIKLETNRASEDLFDEAVLLCLEGNFKQNQNKIISLFIKSFITDKNIEAIKFHKFKNYNIYLQGFSFYDGIYLRNDSLQKPNRVPQDIAIIFHELTHIDTHYKNRQKSFVNNDKFDYYVNVEGLTINRTLGYGLYFLSPDEFNSRKNEIVYIKKFIERMEFLMETFEELKTKENVKRLKGYKKHLLISEKKLNYFYKIYETLNGFTVNHMKNHAIKALGYVKKCDNNEIDLNNQNNKKHLENSIYTILTYLNVYKDKKFFNEVFNYVQTKQTTESSYLSADIVNILKSGCKVFSKTDLDKLLIVFNDDNLVASMNLNKSDLIKHELLFYGSSGLDKTKEVFGQQISEDIIKKTRKKFKDYKFQGIPFDYCVGDNNKINFVIKLNGKEHKFLSKKEMFLEVLKYINSTMLDELNEQNIKEINSLFERDVILDLSKQETTQNNNFQTEKNKKNIQVFNKLQSDIQIF